MSQEWLTGLDIINISHSIEEHSSYDDIIDDFALRQKDFALRGGLAQRVIQCRTATASCPPAAFHASPESRDCKQPIV